ncbi:MAG TPA: hypothetical protein VFN88_06270 [Caulobacteraceae bacterium]|nr:hypothetical protein [Caulobacteraceae bacterium]
MTKEPIKGLFRQPQDIPGATDHLAYTIELWNLSRTAAQRVIGRAEKRAVAEQLYKAAAREYPARLIVLRDSDGEVRRTD